MRRVIVWVALLVVGLVLAGCKSQAGAAESVQAYLQARVQSDVDKMISLACPEWEAQARIEASTFKALNAQLVGVSCSDSSTDGSITLVSCKGKIVTTYNGETREWSISDHQFKTVLDDGEWRMCGYQ
jgi:predicted small secreted protein